MPNCCVYENQFLVPLPFLILFVLHTEIPTDEYIVIIYYLAEIFRIHYNHFLPSVIDDFLFLNILKWRTVYIRKLSLRHNNCFHLNVFLYRNISDYERRNCFKSILTLLQIARETAVFHKKRSVIYTYLIADTFITGIKLKHTVTLMFTETPQMKNTSTKTIYKSEIFLTQQDTAFLFLAKFLIKLRQYLSKSRSTLFHNLLKRRHKQFWQSPIRFLQTHFVQLL